MKSWEKSQEIIAFLLGNILEKSQEMIAFLLGKILEKLLN